MTDAAMMRASLGGEKQSALRATQKYSATLGALLPDRRANADWLRGLDVCLQRSAGVCLHHFVPGTLMKQLCEGQTLQKLKAKPDDPERVFRVCLQSETGQRQWELQRVFAGGTEVCPALHVTIDQGSIGFSGLTYLSQRIRTTCCPDVLHRVTNDYLISVGRANLASLRTAFKRTSKLCRGSNESGHSILNRCATEFFQMHGHGTPLFQTLLQDLLREMGPDVGGSNMTEETQLQLWNELANTLPLAPLGETVKSARWWNLEVHGRHLMRRRWRTLLVLIQLGNVRKWWSTGKSCLFGRGGGGGR
eukprot:6492458-Amphidinium_carterae.5